MAALRDIAAETADEATRRSVFDRFHHTYLINQYKDGLDKYKLLPGEADRSAFIRVIDGGGGAAAANGLIGAAYVFFRNKLAVERVRDESFSLTTFEAAVATRLEVAEISTTPTDNVHRILQTLNSSGVKLTQVDLIRNHIFMLLGEGGDRLFQETWLPMERDLGMKALNDFFFADVVRRSTPGERYYREGFMEQFRLI